MDRHGGRLILLLVHLATADELPDWATDAGWCTEEHRLFDDDGAWCSAVPADCPGMAARCAEPDDTDTPSWWDRFLDWLRSFRADPPPAPELPALPDFSTVGAVIVAILAVVAAVVALLRWRRPDEPTPATATASTSAPGRSDGGPDDPLRDADAAAAAGRYEEALMLLRAVAFRTLVARGAVRADDSATDREHLRFLGRRAEAEPWRTLVQAVERVRYARLAGDASVYARARAAAARLVVVTAALFCCVVLPAWAGARDQTYIRSWLSQRWSATERDDSVTFAQDDVWVVPDGAGDPDLDEKIRDALRSGATVIVVLPKVDEDDPLTTWAPKSFDAVDGTVVAEAGLAQAPLVSPGMRLAVPFPVPEGVLARADGVPVIVGTPVDQGYLVVVGVLDAFDDAALLHPENLGYWETLLDRLVPPRVFVEPEAPVDTSSLAVFRRAGLGGFLLQGLVLVALVAWHGGRPFAAPRDPVPERRRDFVAHIRAVASVYRRAAAERRMVAADAAWTVHRLRHRLRAEPGSLAGILAARTGLPEARVGAALRWAERVGAHPDDPPAADDALLQATLREVAAAALPDRARAS